MITEQRCIEILKELHQMKLQLDSCSDIIKEMNTTTMKSVFLKRNGSIRGRRNLVQNTVRAMKQRDIRAQTSSLESTGVVVYLTSCGILRKSYDKCKSVINILEAFRVKYEVRDLNINVYYVRELADKLNLGEYEKELIFDSLPLVYINGYYLGNEKIITDLNDNKKLESLMEKYQSPCSKCVECGNRGYIVCRQCHGSHRHSTNNTSDLPFGLQLKCTFCDKNGITRCPNCS